MWLNQDTKGPPDHTPLFPATQWVEEGGETPYDQEFKTSLDLEGDSH